MLIIPAINPQIEAAVHFPEVEIEYREDEQGFECVARGKVLTAKMVGKDFISLGNLFALCNQVNVGAICRQLN